MLLINHNTKTYRNPDHTCREESQGVVQLMAVMNKGCNSIVSAQQSPDWLRELIKKRKTLLPINSADLV